MLSRKTTRGFSFAASPTHFSDTRKTRRARSCTTIEVISGLCFCIFVFITARLQAPHLFHNYKDVEEWNNKLHLTTAATPPPLTVHIVPQETGPAATVPPEPVNIPVVTPQTEAPVVAEVTPEPKVKQKEHNESISAKRQEAVRNALLHAWEGYDQLAFGHDELRPTTNVTNDSWNGWGVTIFDGLDTMILMGLTEQVKKVREHIAKVDFNIDYGVSFFETTIRYLGGLLSAFALSKDPFYLERAKSLGELLIVGFEKTPSGLPESVLNLKTKASHNHAWNGLCLLSEVGSSQVEYAFLSFHTKDPSFYKKSRQVYTTLDRLQKPLPGLYPVFLHPNTGEFSSDRISFGSLADSFYEYLLKLYLMNGDQDSLRMYNEAVAGMKEHLIKTVTYESESESGEKSIRKHVFLGELQGKSSVPTMEHLTCFVPGMLALGAHLIPLIPAANRTAHEETRAQLAAEDIRLAEELAATCVGTYFDSSTGLGAESISFHTGETHGKPSKKKQLPGDHVHDMYDMFEISNPKYILRPETIESLFVLWRVTGDTKYQEWGWAIFEALEKQCRTPAAYSGLKNVDRANTGHEQQDIENNWDNSMQSFFWAETLKYLYLLFAPRTLLPLHLYVFTTEAHPLSVLPGGIADRIATEKLSTE